MRARLLAIVDPSLRTAHFEWEILSLKSNDTMINAVNAVLKDQKRSQLHAAGSYLIHHLRFFSIVSFRCYDLSHLIFNFLFILFSPRQSSPLCHLSNPIRSKWMVNSSIRNESRPARNENELFQFITTICDERCCRIRAKSTPILVIASGVWWTAAIAGVRAGRTSRKWGTTAAWWAPHTIPFDHDTWNVASIPQRPAPSSPLRAVVASVRCPQKGGKKKN